MVDVYLRGVPADANPNDVRLYPFTPPAPPVSTEYAGLRVAYSGSTHQLAMVPVADAPTGLGGIIKITKGTEVYALWIVDTSDGDASHVRVQMPIGVKSVRLF